MASSFVAKKHDYSRDMLRAAFLAGAKIGFAFSREGFNAEYAAEHCAGHSTDGDEGLDKFASIWAEVQELADKFVDAWPDLPGEATPWENDTH